MKVESLFVCQRMLSITLTRKTQLLVIFHTTVNVLVFTTATVIMSIHLLQTATSTQSNIYLYSFCDFSDLPSRYD